MEKSILLNYLLQQANKLKENDRKSALTSNYFLVALLEIINLKKKSNLPNDINNEESLLELEEIIEVMNKYDFDRSQALNMILESIHSPSYNSSMDEFIYSKINYNLELKAKKYGRSKIDAYTILSLILEEPSYAIKAYIISPNTSEGSDKKIIEEEKKVIAEIKSQLIKELEEKIKPTEENKKDEEDKKEEEIVNNEANAFLFETISRTQKIQKFLLENVYGQDQAINAFVSGYFQSEIMRTSRKGIQKPQATFLFAGPPGVGKTFLAEKVAEALKLPYKRFDMSEYSDKEANLEFCGSDKVYKDGKVGNVTSFVSDNPYCVLLFDEIEKAHINVIHLFLQILDAGRIRDNYTDAEVSFTNAIIIFTTNAGKNLYNNAIEENLSSIPRKKILKALSSDINPETRVPLFPAAICSRFSSGNVVMFNFLGVNNLYTIAQRELQNNIEGFKEKTNINIEVSNEVSTAIILSCGGNADARAIKGRINSFFYEELYELFRLLSSDLKVLKTIKTIKIDISRELEDIEILNMFNNCNKPEVLIFADEKNFAKNNINLDNVIYHITNDFEKAKEILFNHSISIILCDIFCKQYDSSKKVLNVEDIKSKGMDFLTYILANQKIPVYLLQNKKKTINREEFLSFAKLGVRDVIYTCNDEKDSFENQIIEKCNIAYQQKNMQKLSRENRVLQYSTAQAISKDKKGAEIILDNFNLILATDVEDSKSILEDVSKPNVLFDDVIGAEDAKSELQYFVQYLKDPIKHIRKGVRAPKGVLLHGPSGTGKTLLAKAMAGESKVTFLVAEGNQFLKKYVGEGAEAVHKLFESARKYAPSIIFIDEIDAIGKNREKTGMADTTGDILTALLTEMDGFKEDNTKPVFVLAATNYSVEQNGGKSLDPALVRRFDRKIYVDLPTKEERKKFLLLKVSKNSIVSLSDEQIENIAIRSTGMSLAELDSIFEMALRNAIRSDDYIVDDNDFEEAFETFNSGEKKQWSKELLERTARHEAGHALLCWLSDEKPSYLTITARGNHGGYMQNTNDEEKLLYTKKELLNKIRTALAGRACELVYYGEEDGVSTGASGDLYTATNIAEQMLSKYGMDEKIGLLYANDTSNGMIYKDEIRKRANEVLWEELVSAKQTIQENREAIDAMVFALMEKNHLKGKEIDEIFKKTVKR